MTNASGGERLRGEHLLIANEHGVLGIPGRPHVMALTILRHPAHLRALVRAHAHHLIYVRLFGAARAHRRRMCAHLLVDDTVDHLLQSALREDSPRGLHHEMLDAVTIPVPNILTVD